MKQLIAFLCMAVLYHIAFAQNTFPTDGNVGIGIASPGSKLDIRGGGVNVGVAGDDRYINLFGTWRTQSTAAGLWDQKMVGENLAFHYYNGSSWLTNRLVLSANGLSSDGSLSITGSGNSFIIGSLGVGTSSPSERLEVNGKLKVGNTQIWDNEINRYNNDNLYIGYRNTANTILQANGGNVGIGTVTPREKLSVNGKIRAHEIKVETINWPDYVFSSEHKLPSLPEVERFIKENKHLPEIPSAAEIEKDGINLGEINTLLLKKIEELTLHMIQLKKEVEELKKKSK